MSFERWTEQIKATALDNITFGEFGPHISSDGHVALMDQIEKIYWAGVRAAVDNDIREKMREALRNEH